MTRIIPRSGTASEWSTPNPVLGVGEQGFETDTKKTKRGDGSTHWNDLPYDPTGSIDGLGVSLYSRGLSDSTTDIGALINAAFTAGIKHVVVPYRASAWPSLTSILGTGVWLEFEAGARISNDHNAVGVELTNSRLTNASFTSIYTGPASSGDATSATYAYPARATALRDNCVVDGSYYHEYATQGLAFLGAHCRVTCALKFKNIRHQRGWANAIHAGQSTDIYDNRCTGPIYIEDCDRGIENEDGAHDIVYSGGGHLKNVYPNGYTGSGSAASYENYTFVLDAHAHSGSGGVWGIRFLGSWIVENCGGGVSFIRSTGTSDSDMPRNCIVEDVRFIGRGLSTGYKDIDVQGFNNRVGRAVFEVGAGIAGTNFYINGQAGSLNNRVGEVVVEGSAYPLITKSGPGLQVGPAEGIAAASRSGKFIALPNRSNTTSNALTNGTLRTTPVWVPEQITIDQLGAEITAAGDSGCVLRIGIFNNLNGLPGSPLADVTVAADAIATPMATLGTPLVLSPGWYHIGGVVQGVSSVQPTVRSHQIPPPDHFPIYATAVGALFVGYSKAGITGALSNYGTSISITAIAPRILARLSA